MRRRRRKASLLRRLLPFGLAALGLVTVEETVWSGLEAMGPRGRARVALGTAVLRTEMARYGIRRVGIEGLSWSEAVATRHRLGLGLLPNLGPGFLNVRFGTVQRIGAGRYAVDARVEARWANGHRLRESRIELTVRDGSAVVTARRPIRFTGQEVPCRERGMLSSPRRQYP